MRVQLLGRPAITGEDGPVELRGPRQAGLLALLAAEVGHVVRTSRIEDELWDGQRVSESAVRVNVNRLRARFLTVTGHDAIVSHSLGYSLTLDPTDVDTTHFVAAARATVVQRSAGRLDDAIRRADQAERWWRGPAFEGVAELPSVRPEHDRLEALRCDVWQERATALLQVGANDEALAQLDVLIAASPYRESAWGLRLLGLSRSGRRDEAAARFRELTVLLDAELAMAPDPVIVELADAIRSGLTEPAAVQQLLLPARGDRPVELTEPDRVEPRAGRARRRPPGDLPFVGRAELLDELEAVTAGANAAGRAPIMVVEGPPGIGKTRLAAELAARIDAAGGLAVASTCPREGGSSIAPIADLVEAAAAAITTGQDRHRLDGLEPLAALVPGRFPTPAIAPDPDPDIRRLQLFDAASQALERVPNRPLLVIVDDVHWIAADSARFLHHLIERSDATWLLLTRPGDRSPAAVDLLADVARWQPAWRALEPLDAEDIALLVDQAPTADGSWADTVTARSGGNPFLATELIRHLVSGGDQHAVPPGVEQLVAATAARLSPSAVEVARLLTVGRASVPHLTLAGAAGLSGPDSDRAVAELVASGLATSTRSDARVAHDLVADALDASIGDGRRRQLHTSIGRALALTEPDLSPAALGHLLAGDHTVEPGELDHVAAVALHQLNAGASYHETVRLGTGYLEASVDEPVSKAGLDARIQLAAAMVTAGPYGRGRALLDRITPQIRRQGDAVLSADAILAQGAVNVANPELAVQVDEARLVLDALDVGDAARRIQLASLIAHHLALLGRTAEALDVLDAADEANRIDPDPGLQGTILAMRVQVASGWGTSPMVARTVFAALDAHADAHPSTSTEAWRRLFALHQALRDGTLDDHAAAIDALELTLGRFPRAEARWAVAAARAGNALARGDLDRGERLILEAQVTGGELSVGSAAAVWLVQLFMLQHEREDLAPMTPFLSSLVENASSYQLAARALLLIESGDLSRAREMAARLAERDAMLAESGAGWASLAAQVGDIAFATGDRRLAANALVELAPHAGSALSGHGFLFLGAAERSLGAAHAALGDLDRAIDALEQAHADDRRRGAPRWAGRAARSAAAVRRQRRRRGDIAAARSLDQEAARLLTTAH